MNLSDLLNIRKQNIDKAIIDAINNTKNKLQDLTEEQTCLIWSSYIYNELWVNHVNAQLLSTEDIKDAYLHYFVAIPYGKGHYVIDLTFKQFNSPLFSELQNKGYQYMDNSEEQTYLEIITQKKNIKCSFDDLYFGNLPKRML